MRVARASVFIGAALLAMAAGVAPAAQYETLLSLSQAEQERVLRAVINSAGYSCPKVTATLFKGIDRETTGYWAVACTDGSNWMVSVQNNADGSTSTVPCPLLKTLNIECWKKF